MDIIMYVITGKVKWGGGGGVSLFIKDSITYQCRVDLDIVNEFIECVFIEIPKVEGLINKNLIIESSIDPQVLIFLTLIYI